MSDSIAPDNATVGWRILTALIVVAFVAALAWFINWRSAPPPPPPLPAGLLLHS